MPNVEREIKLRFESADDARIAVAAAGATPLRDRRLQDDYVYDWPDARLRQSRCLLRIRLEDGQVTLTFKGPPQSTTMKVREEIETTAGDSESLRTVLDRLGLNVQFHYQKYRQEFQHAGVVLAIDETPVGTFVELEGDEGMIRQIATGMGHRQSDYIVDSYRELFLKERQARGLHGPDMVFHPSP